MATSATIISSDFKDDASSASYRAQAANAQVGKDLNPVVKMTDKYGPKYVINHANKSLVSDVEAAENFAQQISRYNAEANRYDAEYIGSQYTGLIILVIGSACIGAVAGWMLIPLVIGRRVRRHN